MDLTEGIVKELSKRVAEQLHTRRVHEFDEDVRVMQVIEQIYCSHTEWEWLDCDECEDCAEVCGEKMCVACGESI